MYAFAARVAVELDIFNILSRGQNSISASELSQASEGSTELIGKVIYAVNTTILIHLC